MVHIGNIVCRQAVHNFTYVSQESLSRAIHAAEQDVQQKKDVTKKHSVDVPQYHVSHRTKIVNSREYVKRLKRRQQRHSRVSNILDL